jgi:iron complex outermembrane receptor protein
MKPNPLRALILISGILTSLSLAEEVAGQIPPDTILTDTIPRPVFRLLGLTVLVPRPVSTTGGASAVEVILDSMVVRPAPTLEQVLREMPLIQIRRNSRGEAQPALRGGEDRQIAILMDGVPLTLGWDARTDLSVIPMTAAQRVTLIRGLSSVLHGPNVLGGVVEVDVARGADRQQAPGAFRVDLGLDHTGARGLGVSGGTLVETSGGEWVFRAGAGHQSRDGFVLPNGAAEVDGIDTALLSQDGDLITNTDSERFDGFFSARFRTESGRWMSLSSSGFKAERGVAPEAHVEDPRLWRYPEQARMVTAVSAGTGQRSTAWGEGDLEASLGLDLGSTEIEEFATVAYEDVTATESSDDLTLTVRLIGDHSLSEDGELRTALTYADVRHDEVLDGVEENSYRQRLWSFGSEAEWRFGDLLGTQMSRLTLGAAIDGADTPETGGKPALGTLWDWGGRVGFTTLAGSQNVLFHGAVSRRTRFPALRELYSGALGRFVPNPDLRPEVLLGGELGFTLDGNRVGLQAVGFHQRLEDGIVRSSVSTPEGKKYKRINQDQVRSTGLELLASGSLGGVALSGDLTLQRVRGIGPAGDEVKLEYEPKVAGKVAAMVPLPLEVEGGAAARFMGEQYCENPDVGGLQTLDGSQHLDLSLRRAFQFGGGTLGKMEASVNVDNVTDAVVWDQCGLPQPGRTMRVQFRLW